MPPFAPTSTGLRLRLRVTPNASADRIEGAETLADGTAVLRVRVRAVAEGGRANAAVLALLARALGVPKSAVTLVAGGAARVKVVEVAGEPGVLSERAGAL